MHDVTQREWLGIPLHAVVRIHDKKSGSIKTRTQEDSYQIGIFYFNKEPKRVNLNQKKVREMH